LNTNEKNGGDRQPAMVKLYSVTRYIVGLAVVGIIVGSTVLMLLGVFGILFAVYISLTEVSASVLEQLRIAMIEATDLFLVSTALFVIAAGLYQLFVNPNASRYLPPWLRVDELDALEDRMIGMVVAVSSVVFLTLLLEWHGQFDILAAGVGVGAVITAASLFKFASARGHESSNDDHEDNGRNR
jgi:uncharacterized membrane protein YqhA